MRLIILFLLLNSAISAQTTVLQASTGVKTIDQVISATLTGASKTAFDAAPQGKPVLITEAELTAINNALEGEVKNGSTELSNDPPRQGQDTYGFLNEVIPANQVFYAFVYHGADFTGNAFFVKVKTAIGVFGPYVDHSLNADGHTRAGTFLRVFIVKGASIYPENRYVSFFTGSAVWRRGNDLGARFCDGDCPNPTTITNQVPYFNWYYAPEEQ